MAFASQRAACRVEQGLLCRHGRPCGGAVPWGRPGVNRLPAASHPLDELNSAFGQHLWVLRWARHRPGAPRCRSGQFIGKGTRVGNGPWGAPSPGLEGQEGFSPVQPGRLCRAGGPGGLGGGGMPMSLAPQQSF